MPGLQYFLKASKYWNSIEKEKLVQLLWKMPKILVNAVFSTKNFQSVGLPTNNVTSSFWIERGEFVYFFFINERLVWGKKVLHLSHAIPNPLCT